MKKTFLTNGGLVCALALGIAACSGPNQPQSASDTAPPEAQKPESVNGNDWPGIGTLSTVQDFATGSWRSPTEKARDQWRHPVETLDFFGVESSDTVVEIWPGGGWYTNILAPYLAAGDGQLIAAIFDVNAFEGERRARIEERIAAYKAVYEGDPERFGTIIYTAFSSQSAPLAPAGSVDSVLTFRNVHNWMSGDYAAKFFVDAYAALKPGGVLGVVEHRLPSNATQDPRAASGYVHEDFVKSLAIQAGFEFAGASEINANPADTADHPFGVWTLPPVSRTADRDGKAPDGFDPEAYKAIGESDRMTLKFIKPAASDPDAAP